MRIAYDITYTAGLFWIGESIFHDRVKEKGKYVMAAAYLLTAVLTAQVFGNSSIMSLLSYIIMFLILFGGSIRSRMIHFGIVYLLVNMVESMIYGISVIFIRPSEYENIGAGRTGEISLLFAIITMVVILSVVNKKWTQHFIACFQTLDRIQYFVIVLLVWSGILLIGSMTVSSADERRFAAAIVFMAAAFAGMILLVFNVYRKDLYQKQNRMKEELIRSQQMYVQSVYNNDREMRKFRHDISSQLRCLRLLLADGKTDEAIDYLQITQNHFEELKVFRYHTGNDILDVVLNQKIQEISEKGISVEISGKMDKPDFMDIYDLCTVFSNVLDNAAEACEKMRDREAVIAVSIISHGNSVFFRFVNPANMEMYEAVQNGKTMKSDKHNHGFGLENIQRAVDKNGGKIEYLFQEEKMITEIYFEI